MEVIHGDCLDVLRAMADNSVDAVVTDPPYGLRFMGRKWDYDVPSVDVWAECLRVLKPGGHLLAFSGSRTYHRMTCRIEDAGFEIRDMGAWLYSTGFPKNLDVSKAIDMAAGAEREVTRLARGHVDSGGVHDDDNYIWRPIYERKDRPATEAARQWSGWGTALKPAHEPICFARKPLIGTVAENVMAHGTGALNIDASRIPANPGDRPDRVGGSAQKCGTNTFATDKYSVNVKGSNSPANELGRWPANVMHDGSEEVLALFPESKGMSGGGKHKEGARKGMFGAIDCTHTARGDAGSAARFFYCAKASKADRDEGLDGFDEVSAAAMAGNLVDSQRLSGSGVPIKTPKRANHHPTVKPTSLMRYLVRLVTPPNGTVLDPFAGSGSTGKACALEGFKFIGIEREKDYIDIATARINAAIREQDNETDLRTSDRVERLRHAT